jgi:hypothetical protein
MVDCGTFSNYFQFGNSSTHRKIRVVQVMKVIIAGTRTFADYEFAKKHLDHHLGYLEVTEVVSGACNTGVHTFTRPDGTRVYGADGLGEKWAAEKNIPVKPFPADWNKNGLAAGPIRNGEMAEYLNPAEDKVIVFHNAQSKGAADMLKKARKRGISTEYVAI